MIAKTCKALVAAAALLSVAPLAAADWPEDKPVRVVVAYPAGGTTDFVGRLLAQKFSESTGRSFIVDNRPGATGTIGTTSVAKAAPDGHTILLMDITYAILPSLFANLSWDHASDLVPVTSAMDIPVVLMVPVASPFKTLKELTDYARKNPDKLTFGSGGQGSSVHFAAELLKKQAGVAMTHIPYKGGGEAMAGLISGQIDMIVDSPATGLAQIQGGRARALAVSGARRVPALPDVPTFAEAGMPDYKFVQWYGIAVPKGTPAPVIAKLNAEARKALAADDVRAKMAERGGEPRASDPAAFSRLIQDETRRWGQLAKEIGIKAE